jgi:hypothetical protein
MRVRFAYHPRPLPGVRRHTRKHRNKFELTHYPSFVESVNLTMRMNMRRFTRLTLGFSKKIENHKHAVALNFVHYNFCRIHQTLRITPAMAAGVTTTCWEIEDMIELLSNVVDHS